MTDRAPKPLQRTWMQDLVLETADVVESWTEYNRCLIYGEFGAGKTRFCGVPGVFLLDFDDGLTTLRANGKVPNHIEIRKGDPHAYEKTMGVIEDLRSQSGVFAKDQPLASTRVVALDGITAMAEIFLEEIMLAKVGPGGDITAAKPEFDEWGILVKRLATVVEALKQIPYHVIVTAMAKIDKDAATQAYIGEIDILGSYRTIIGRRFDEVYYVEKRRARPEEKAKTGAAIANDFYTAYHPRFKVKSRLGTANRIADKIANPTWATMIGPLYTKKGGLE